MHRTPWGTIIAGGVTLAAALACVGTPDTDTDPGTPDTDTTSGVDCPLGMTASRDAAVSITQFQIGSNTLTVSVDPTVDHPTYGPSVCVGDTSARLLVYTDSLVGILTFADAGLGTYGLNGHLSVEYRGGEGNITYTSGDWQSGTLGVLDDDPYTLQVSNGYAITDGAQTMSLTMQAEIARP